MISILELLASLNLQLVGAKLRSEMSMFSSYATPAKRWRARAKEALAFANQMSDPDAEEVMWRLALRYERMAKQADCPLNRAAQSRLLPIGSNVLSR